MMHNNADELDQFLLILFAHEYSAFYMVYLNCYFVINTECKNVNIQFLIK